MIVSHLIPKTNCFPRAWESITRARTRKRSLMGINSFLGSFESMGINSIFGNQLPIWAIKANCFPSRFVLHVREGRSRRLVLHVPGLGIQSGRNPAGGENESTKKETPSQTRGGREGKRLVLVCGRHLTVVLSQFPMRSEYHNVLEIVGRHDINEGFRAGHTIPCPIVHLNTDPSGKGDARPC
jgi:hypothetical protein